MRHRWVQAAALPCLLAACSNTSPGTTTAGGIQLHPVVSDQQVADYAKKPYEPFSRVNAVAVALREWRAWGMAVNDAPPDSGMPVSIRPDRQPGLWQRVGDYWWAGQDALTAGSGWTGKYGDFGTPYTGDPAAWSAAFISYLMRTAGAGDRFPYSPLHATYINAAAQGNAILQALPTETTPPVQGDLICYGRRGGERLRLSDLPAPSFYGHCDFIVAADPGQLTVIGGNVSAGVTMKHIPLTPSGNIATADGTPVDRRYPWFVVLHVLYDDNATIPVALAPPVTYAPPFEPTPVALPPQDPEPTFRRIP